VDPQALAHNGFKAASAGSLFLGQLGTLLVWGGTLLFLCSVLSMLAGGRFQSFGKWTFVCGSICILGAFGVLADLFLTDQYAFDYIANHSWRNLAPSYKFAAVWSGQQGSFLLWASTSAIFGLLAIWRTGPYLRWFTLIYSLFLGGLCGILAYETPFGLIKELFVSGVHYAPPDGMGLTPSLQNYWVIIHPPTIFTGFGSLTVLFAFAVSAILTGNAKEWVARVRPWALVSVAILGLGLVMGGLWAYETQGWGGFWAWDPVENVSFVPWLFAVAFVHGIIVQTTRGRWHGTNLLMGGLPFLLFVYGTFLTRSGFLSKFSVHSFAEMNRSALWILMVLLILMSAGFVALWAFRGTKLGKVADKPLLDEGFNRGKAYQGGVILLSGLSTAIAIGMSIPFFMGLRGATAKVVEEPLYHSVVVWFFAPIMLLMGAAPFLSWRAMRAGAFWGRLINVIGLTIGVLGIMMFALKMSDWSAHSHELPPISFPFGIAVPRFSWVMCLFALTSFAAIANIWRLVELFPRSKLGIGGFMAHLGVATAMSGLILSRGLEMRTPLFVAENDPDSGLGYTVSYSKLTSDPQTDRDNKVEFDIRSDSGTAKTITARPGFFFTAGEGGQPSAFTWPHIEHSLTHDLYLSLGSPILTFWKEPENFKVGETKDFSDPGQGTEFKVSYLGMQREGEAGKPGTAFAAKIKIVENGREYIANPKIVVGQQTLPVLATPNFYAAMVGMDAADKSAVIELFYRHPIYPIELFYKPMTMLVWIGTGMMTLGGLLSAFYRRNRRRPPSAEEAMVENVEKEDNAAVPVS
jgi:cytochrome c-type biogenesis protein CcmF